MAKKKTKKKASPKVTYKGTVEVRCLLALADVPASSERVATNRMIEIGRQVAEACPKRVHVKGIAEPFEVYMEVSDVEVEPDGWGAEREEG